MEKPLIKPEQETVWYENDRPIQEFLHSFQKCAITKKEIVRNQPSLLKLVQKSHKLKFRPPDNRPDGSDGAVGVHTIDRLKAMKAANCD